MDILVPVVGLETKIFEWGIGRQFDPGLFLQLTKGCLKGRFALLESAFGNPPTAWLSRKDSSINSAFPHKEDPPGIEVVE